MNVKGSNAARGAMATALIGAIDTGSGNALLKFYTGTQPAGPDTAISSQTLLGTLTCSDPVGSQSNGVITFSAITDDSAADATGTCTWARLVNPAGDAVMDFDVTATGGGGAITLNTVSIVSGGPIQISSMTITIG